MLDIPELFGLVPQASRKSLDKASGRLVLCELCIHFQVLKVFQSEILELNLAFPKFLEGGSVRWALTLSQCLVMEKPRTNVHFPLDDIVSAFYFPVMLRYPKTLHFDILFLWQFLQARSNLMDRVTIMVGAWMFSEGDYGEDIVDCHGEPGGI